MPVYKKVAPSLSRIRSAVTNGTHLLKDVDQRSAIMRRFRDLLQAHQSDLGGADLLSEGQKSLVRRVATLEMQLELLEGKFVENDGAATAAELEIYQRAASALRRLLESLELHRGRHSRDVTPTVEQWKAAKLREKEQLEEAAE